jgi:hypothetical protein
MRVSHVRLAAFAVLLVMTSSARAGTVLQFTQTNPFDSVSAIQSGSTTTLSTAGNADGGFASVPVTITNYNGMSLNVPPLSYIPAFETFEGVTSVGPAVSFFGLVEQSFSGTIVFSQLPGGVGTNYLTVKFTDATFFGSGSSATLQTSTNSTVSYSSDFINTLDMPGFSLSFSGISPAVSTTDNTLANLTGQQTGTFSAVIPEPSTVVLGTFPLVIGALVSLKRKRIKR